MDIIIRNLCLLVVYFCKDIPFGNRLFLRRGVLSVGKISWPIFMILSLIFKIFFHTTSNSTLLVPPCAIVLCGPQSLVKIWPRPTFLTTVWMFMLEVPLSSWRDGSPPPCECIRFLILEASLFDTSTESLSHTPACIANSTTDNMIPTSASPAGCPSTIMTLLILIPINGASAARSAGFQKIICHCNNG